ncbi:MAG: hypothetical protein A2W27_08480 [Deltaproteobacteria bacterium RBG_16_44_11]|nr:MAG: hypothetical protein A2W27_08480 [Deltaproteobacteria bacterium RBG_16_44_11]
MSIASFQKSQHNFLVIFSKKSWKTLRKRKNNPLEIKHLKIAVNFHKLKHFHQGQAGNLPIFTRCFNILFISLRLYIRFYNCFHLHYGIDYHTPVEYEKIAA